MQYRGRLAPSPTGFLHLGHARTFWIAQQRAREADGILILRIEDLDRSRIRPEFVQGIYDDLRWFGFNWQEGPDIDGPHTPYTQSERMDVYRQAFQRLRETGAIYPCTCSRQDVLQALGAPHQGEEEPIYPGTCRPKNNTTPSEWLEAARPTGKKISWRFRVPDREKIGFEDKRFGSQSYECGRDFGDFVVWRHDDIPAYQLAVVVDDIAMGITEVVRGADLLMSTARQLLLYRALNRAPPDFYHCELITDSEGVRLAKRHAALSLRQLREEGGTASQLRTTLGLGIA